jgi:hypothetical protein
MELSEPLRQGELVTLQDRGHDMAAQIKWVLGDEAGGLFLLPLDATL